MSTQPANEPATGPVDLVAVIADLQQQLTALERAVAAQQATIDAITDITIDLLKAHDDGRR